MGSAIIGNTDPQVWKLLGVEIQDKNDKNKNSQEIKGSKANESNKEKSNSKEEEERLKQG